MKIFIKKYPLVLLLIIHIAVAIFRCLFVIFGNANLHFEEAQYWVWSQHLDWSYYSKPPMVAFLNYLSEWIFGHSEFSVRINAIVFGFLIALVTYTFAKELFKDKRLAFWASMLVYVMPFFHGASMFFSTDAPLLFFFLWAMHQAWLSIQYNRLTNWLLLAVALGLGYLSKYAMLFFIPSLLLYLYKEEKSVFRNKNLYIALCVSVLFFLPVIVWNFKYDFIGFKHILHLSGVTDTPNPLWRRLLQLADYLGGQLAIVSPLFLVLYYKAFKKGIADKRIRFLLLPALLVFLTFIGVALTRRAGANINWTMFAYVGFPIFLAHYIVTAHKQKIATILFTITLSIFLLATHSAILDRIGLGQLFSPKLDPVKRLVGWEALAKDISEIKALQETDNLFIFSNSYHTTSELLFYMYPEQDIYYANMGHRMTQFNLWKGIEQFENKAYKAIYVVQTRLDKGNKKPTKQAPPLPLSIRNAFDKEYEYATHIVSYRGADLFQFHIYILSNFKTLKTNTQSY